MGDACYDKKIGGWAEGPNTFLGDQADVREDADEDGYCHGEPRADFSDGCGMYWAEVLCSD